MEQQKLTRDEWNSIELPVSPEEKDIFMFIRESFRDIHHTLPRCVSAYTYLKIPPSNYHESRDGDTLYSISRVYSMKVNDLIALNNLKFPYQIYPGEKIKIVRDNNKKSA